VDKYLHWVWELDVTKLALSCWKSVVMDRYLDSLGWDWKWAMNGDWAMKYIMIYLSSMFVQFLIRTIMKDPLNLKIPARSAITSQAKLHLKLEFIDQMTVSSKGKQAFSLLSDVLLTLPGCSIAHTSETFPHSKRQNVIPST
jgi:hypothetical protein